MDKRTELPTWAMINHLVWQDLVAHDEHKNAFRRLEVLTGVPSGSLVAQPFNDGHTLALLYLLVVVPKEVWQPSDNHKIYSDAVKRCLLDPFTIHVESDRFKKHPMRGCLDHLRNAVSHANFSITRDRFTFWDRRSQRDDINFKASISMEDLGRFAAEIGKILDEVRRA